MKQPQQSAARKEEDRRQFRPYRRFVRIVFFLAMAVLCGLILRGIIRSLDRMPTPQGARPTGPLDARALRACAEDLTKLEGRLRSTASELLGRAPSEPAEWAPVVAPLEMERLEIVTRCNLDEPTNDAVVEDLKQAASALDDLARSYRLLYDRHRAEGRERSEDAIRALERATQALNDRK